MSGSNVAIHGPDGEFSAYLATPRSGRGPAVVVIQEIFGVNAVMRGIADDLATAGYFALAPDLFWRIERNVQLTDRTEAEWKRAFDFYQKFNVDSGVADIQAAIAHLRRMTGVTGKVGSVGYCLGGLLAYLTAARTDADASVSFYGVGIEGKLAEAASIKKPLMLHIAAKDQFVPPAAQAQIVQALQAKPGVSVHVYPDVDHAFARVGGQHFDKAAADLANRRTAEFFHAHLS
jgi:carboxymethylenebutenolidase